MMVTILPGGRPTTSPAAPPGFVLLDEIGRGGMGVVFRAHDLALDREVAVKLLQERFAPDSTTAARFIEEAHITGQLQHPGVPAVYQVGTLSTGRPFLAMKLIRGSTLDTLLNQNASLDPLSIFESISQTVGYAHAHNVIHRDLKPSNVMVGGFGEVQLMDWGLAKVLARPRSEQASSADPEATTASTLIRSPRTSDSSQTQAGSVLGTPAYMAPEQAAGETDRVDARSDVFGLGAILCVLLTGKPPYGGADVESVRLAAVRGQTEEAFARLDACGADPDVVSLCKRCLAFEQGGRPASGNAVAAEMASLRRAADERARQAERDRLAAEVRAVEQSKRRRAVQWAAGIVVGVLLLGMTGTGIGLYRANTARAEAQAKEVEANAVVKFFEDHVFAAGRPKDQEGGKGSHVSLRDAIVASLPALEKSFAGQPLVEARLRNTLAITFNHLGEAEKAAEQSERARALYIRHLEPDHPTTLECSNNLAISYVKLGRRAEALKLFEMVLAAQKRVLPKDHPDMLLGMHNLAANYYVLGRRTEALKLFEVVLAAQRRVLSPDHPDTSKSMSNLALNYAVLGRHVEAIELGEEALAAQRRVLPPDHPDTLSSMNNLAASYFVLGRHEEALKLREETLAARMRVLPKDNPETINSLSSLAIINAIMDHHAEALKLFEEALAAQRRVLPSDHPDTLSSMNDLANSYAALGRSEESLKLREETLAAQRRVLPKDHPDTLSSMHNLAISYDGLGRREEALKLREETLAALERVQSPDHPKTLQCMWGVAESLVALGRGAEAILVIDECVAKAAGKAVHPQLIPSLIDLRVRHFQKSADPAGCRASAAMWEKLERADASSLYNAACFRAVAAAVQAKAGGADSERLARDDADRSMAWLTKAVAAGFKDRAHMEKDKDLDPLRDRDDFKKMLAGLK